MKKAGYNERIIDKEIEKCLGIFGAISIDGPKWCGKTWTGLTHANSVVYIDDPANGFNNRRSAELNTDLVLGGERPRLIDEWQEVPALWDAVRFKCDEDNKTGKYILTGSATPLLGAVRHSGAGRICRLHMETMSLYETGDSCGEVSLSALFNGVDVVRAVPQKDLTDIARYIIRGGWPSNAKRKYNIGEMPTRYLETVLDSDISDIDGKMRDRRKMEILIKSLARHESTIAGNNTILADIEELTSDNDRRIGKNTITEYLDILSRLYLIRDQPSFSSNVRSHVRVGLTSKHHFIDPSLAAAALNMTESKLMNDLNTFGILFEALCVHDLRIYIESLGGRIYHFRDSNGRNEVDAIVEMGDGEYGAIEIKLGVNKEDEAVANLLKFSELMRAKPKFMAVINGNGSAVYRRPDGVYSLPITALKP